MATHLPNPCWEGLFDSYLARQKGGAIDWSIYANAYDFLPKVFREYRENMEIVEDALRNRLPESGSRVCDLGAGTGVYIERLAKRNTNWKFTHVDSNQGMTRVAKAKYNNLPEQQVAVVDDSAQTVQFPNDSFEAVICVNALYAMPPQDRVIRRIFNWLKPNGVLVCIDFGRQQEPLDWLGEFVRLIRSREIDVGTAVRTLGVISNLLRQAFRGAGGQASGKYWMHELDEFVRAFQVNGFTIDESFICYRGYCDGVIARKPPC
jgi:ubiquinone/menaquinone biosynthesis C-methylase UbiE